MRTQNDAPDTEQTAPRRRLTRGTFVKVVGSTLVAGSLLPHQSTAAFARSLPRPALRSRDYAAFAARVGERFSIRGGSVRVTARLIAADHHGDQRLNRMRYSRIENFSLLFETAAGTALGQGTYRLRNARLGTFHLFLVPGQQNEKSNHYEAIFQRFVQ